MALMSTMDDTLRANGVRVAIEAEVLDFFLRMVLAEVAHGSVGLIHRCIGWILHMRLLALAHHSAMIAHVSRHGLWLLLLGCSARHVRY